jgi:drug/metabolite transporter (DMT)-like permease
LVAFSTLSITPALSTASGRSVAAGLSHVHGSSVAAGLSVASRAPSMPMATVAAVLLAAVLHASWNAIAHGVSDRLVGFTLIGTASAVVGGVGALVTGVPPAQAWPFLLVSAGLHVVYNLLLLASYQLGQFSQVYPLARGTSPWVVALVATTVLGQGLPPAELAGVLIISGGLISLVFLGGRQDRAPRKALCAAFATGLMIAGYTVVDGVGVHRSPVLAYTAWLFLLQGPVVPILAVVRRRRALLAQIRPSLAIGLTGGLVSMAAYGIVLWAQTHGALAPIAALRETSIIVGSVIGALFLGERFGYKRAVASTIVVVGIILINLP